MKKLFVIIPLLILLAVAVQAKCGDNLCDPDEDCESCPDDCLCTRDEHNDPVVCCGDFTCKECEEGYCKDAKCATLEAFLSIFQKVGCFDNGSIDMKITFQELRVPSLTPYEELKVYMKENKEDASFTEITGTWFNPSREGDYRYTKIADTSFFTSDEGLFELSGEYYVRVKYEMGRSYNLFEDTVVKCPGMPKEEEEITPPVVEEGKEEELEVLEPKKEEELEEEQLTEPDTPPIEPAPPKDRWILYAIGVAILFVLIFFVIRYEIRIKKRE